MREALIVFARAPVPGAVKTRLSPPLTDRESASLYAAFLCDTRDHLLELGRPIRWYISGDPSRFPFDASEHESIHVQASGDLGSRMLQAVAESVADGHARLVVVGTDSPTLPVVFIDEAFRALREAPGIALGPSDDGGYYLIGLSRLVPALFRDMPWSTSQVFELTCDRAAALNLDLTILPEWFDVDDQGDLRRLAADLLRDPASAPQTAAQLAVLNWQDNHDAALGDSDICRL